MCGGRDFDRVLVDNVVRPWLVEKFDLPEDFSVNANFKSLLRLATWATERAKIELSARDDSVISLSETEARAGKKSFCHRRCILSAGPGPAGTVLTGPRMDWILGRGLVSLAGFRSRAKVLAALTSSVAVQSVQTEERPRVQDSEALFLCCKIILHFAISKIIFHHGNNLSAFANPPHWPSHCRGEGVVGADTT